MHYNGGIVRGAEPGAEPLVGGVMSPGRLIAQVAPPLFVLGFCCGLAVPMLMPSHATAERVNEVVRLVERDFHRPVERRELIEGALRGVARRLDPYSDYFPPEQYVAFKQEHVEGEFFGVGISVERDPADTGYVRIVAPLDNSPALAAGLRPGDRISAVDGRPVQDHPFEQVILMIKGKEGTLVRLTILREGAEPFDVELKRAKIVKKKILALRMERPGKRSVLYLRPAEFTEGMADEAAQTIRRLKADALIVDVRQNPGGLLDQCVRLSAYFVGRRPILTALSRREAQVKLGDADAMPELAGVPVVVLVNEGSASASEIFAGVLQDYGVAALVGARTFGKGSVQETHPLRDGSYFKLTVATYALPGGRGGADPKFHVAPDHVVSLTPEQARGVADWWSALHTASTAPAGPPADDPQLQKALELIDARPGP
jgi:carboxyl-terminal processing protease